MRNLEQGYIAEVDQVEKSGWNALMPQFQDASYYQTWSFGALHSGERGMSHVVLKRDGVPAGMAQLRIVRVPGFPIGIAYLSAGPLYQPKEGESRSFADHLRNLARALRSEYVVRRGYFLRIVPKVLDLGENGYIKKIFSEERYAWSRPVEQTVLLDLSRSLSEIRQNMDRKWRQTLQSAERQPIDLLEGNSDELGIMAMKIIGEMKFRKKFLGGNQGEALRVQQDLPQSLKLRLALCLVDKEPAAALGWTTVGTVGLPLIAATGDKALKTKSSYVLWWKMIEYYKRHGFLAVDLGGVNKRRNPGGYSFKTHIVGKGLMEQPCYLGQFDACGHFFSAVFFKTVFQSREIYRNMRSMAV